MVGFSMTGTTKSNAILRSCIVFHIVNMMNALAVLATNCASVVVSFANHALEGDIERGWIWLKRNSAQPSRIAFSNIGCVIARLRTIPLIVSSVLWHKCFVAMKTVSGLDCSAGVIHTFLRAVLFSFCSCC